MYLVVCHSAKKPSIFAVETRFFEDSKNSTHDLSVTTEIKNVKFKDFD